MKQLISYFAFRRALLDSVNEAEADGVLSPDKASTIRRGIRFRPLVVLALRNECHEAAIADGKVSRSEDVTEIDWEKLKPFLKELFELILEFISALIIILP